MSIPQPWSLTERIAFRFFFVFFALYIFPFPLTVFLPQLSYYYGLLWHEIVPWFGSQVLQMTDIAAKRNGSGDTTFNYVHLLMQVSISLIATVIWTILSKRRQYDVLHHWLRVGLRFYLFSVMVVYGFIKVFHVQMPSPYLSQLLQPLGDKSPMGLAWTYVGFSAGFSAFTGWAEVIAGSLLIWRRTVTVGAMAGIAVMANVVAINFFYDVPVKLFSSTLLLMSIFLLVPDIPRFIRVFIWNRPVEPKLERTYLPKRWMRITALVISLLFVVYTIAENVYGSMERASQYSESAREAKTPLYGIWDAKLIVRNNDTVQMLLSDTMNWKQLVIESDRYAWVKRMNDSIFSHRFYVDTALHTAKIYFSLTDPADTAVLRYTADSTSLALQGVIRKDSVYFQYVKRDVRSFRLRNHSFRWVNEYPANY